MLLGQANANPGGVTPILDLTGCAAQQGVLLREKLCDRVSFSDKNYATEYRGGSRLEVWGGPRRGKYGGRKFFAATPFRLSENVGNAPFTSF